MTDVAAVMAATLDQVHQGLLARRFSAALCQELIKDICSASARPMDGSAVHFDCAIKAVEQILKPRKGEKVIYQGKGCFAVVDDHAYQNRGLKILRNTDWENLEKAAEWRKSLRTTIR